jgi:hypothetical protein
MTIMETQNTTENLAKNIATTEPVKSLLYWKRHWWAPTPSILSLDKDGNLTLTDKNHIVFQVKINQVTSVRFTSWGTMKLIINGKKYSIVGTPTQYSSRPSKEQLAAMQGGVTAIEVNAGLTQIASTVGAQIPSLAPLNVASAVLSEVAYYRGLGRIRDWQNVFVLSGINTQQSKMHGVKYLWIIGGPVFIVAMILVIVLVGGK